MDRLRCTLEDYENERRIMEVLMKHLREPGDIPLLLEDDLLAELVAMRKMTLHQLDRSITSPYDYEGLDLNSKEATQVREGQVIIVPENSTARKLRIELKARFLLYKWFWEREEMADRGIFLGFDKYLELQKLAEESGIPSYYVVGLLDRIVVYKFNPQDAAQVYANGVRELESAKISDPHSKYVARLDQILTVYQSYAKAHWPEIPPVSSAFRVEPGRRADRLTGAVDAAGEENRVTVIVPIDSFIIGSSVPAKCINTKPKRQVRRHVPLDDAALASLHCSPG